MEVFKMKKLIVLVMVLSAILIAASGCSKENSITHQEKQIDTQLIGTWRHHEVPSLPHYSTWVITINEDGTYCTESDTYETADSGTKSHTEAFGKEGSYTLEENKILFRSNTGSFRTETYEISETDGQTTLVFKDSDGNNKSSVGVGGVTYDLIFIKEN
jgi:hypothetical protein